MKAENGNEQPRKTGMKTLHFQAFSFHPCFFWSPFQLSAFSFHPSTAVYSRLRPLSTTLTVPNPSTILAFGV
jgi:hypothetical protein